MAIATSKGFILGRKKQNPDLVVLLPTVKECPTCQAINAPEKVACGNCDEPLTKNGA